MRGIAHPSRWSERGEGGLVAQENDDLCGANALHLESPPQRLSVEGILAMTLCHEIAVSMTPHYSKPTSGQYPRFNECC